MDGSIIPETCSTMGLDGSNACPASEWYAIRDHLSALGPHYPASPNRFTLTLGSCPVHGQRSARELSSGAVPRHEFFGQITIIALSQQAVVSDALSATGTIWYSSLPNVTANAGHGSPLSDQSTAVHRIVRNYRQPFSQAACIPFEIRNSTGFRPVAIPFLPFTDLSTASAKNLTVRIQQKGRYRVFDYPSYIYSQLLDAPGDVEGYRLKWVKLPRDIFTRSSIGVAVLLPRLHSTTLQRVL